jgi:hypothetical protein
LPIENLAFCSEHKRIRTCVGNFGYEDRACTTKPTAIRSFWYFRSLTMKRLQKFYVAIVFVSACSEGGQVQNVCLECIDSVGDGQEAIVQDDGLATTDREAPDYLYPDKQELATDVSEVSMGEFGSPCQSNSDCKSGLCIEGFEGFICTMQCYDECPEGYVCRGMLLGQDLISLCVPYGASLCKPCKSDSQCPGGRCIPFGSQSFCGLDCSFQSCPPRYECKDFGDTKQCYPSNTSCDCRPKNSGEMRMCVHENENGRCFGVETCDPDKGWIGCTASIPAPEVCNGQDDDCNGITDELWPQVGAVCSVGIGECKRVGTFVCSPDGKETVCSVNAGTPVAELCDGKDNDCDGLIDEDWEELTKVCQAGYGECSALGTWVCKEDGSGVFCNATPAEPSAEICDDKDNDCDGMIDEDFPLKYKPCVVGVGECAKAGVYQCSPDGTDVVCNATPDLPSEELCDNRDNDCDGLTDEDFPDKGQICMSGLGACARLGVYVCSSDLHGVECNAQPGQATVEICDYVDNDCDGLTDEDFLKDGKYYLDTACGNCFTDCTQIYALPNAFGVCDATATPTCVMKCRDGFYDLNMIPDDGCEFALDTSAVYVSASDPLARDDAGCGLAPFGTIPNAYPCKTISHGIQRASSLGRPKVFVADGLYEENIRLTSGISLLGGFRADTWERHVSSTLTAIRGTGGSLHQKTITADGITLATTLEGFIIYGPINTNVGGNSYAIWLKDSTSALVIRANTIYGGSGGPGQNGMNGAGGSAGVIGSPGSPAKEVSANCFEQCTQQMETVGGAGGPKTCEGTDVSGGAGGRAVCPDFQQGVNQCNQCSSAESQTIDSRSNGAQGRNNGGAGGSGGYHSLIDGKCYSSCVCYVPNEEKSGANGANGPDGQNGGAGSGCSSPAGQVVNGEWAGMVGTDGLPGAHGGGGGGGGAGGGVETYYDASCAANGTSDIGGSGGGGGSGGCRGLGGTGGGAGGGAFGIFLVWTGTPASVPVIEGNIITRGFGGRGGQGGSGGSGGPGGAGANGGASGAGNTATFCAPGGGKGGKGGNGGAGGGGGGGCGGASVAIFASGQGQSNIGAYKTANAFKGGGTGGAGGNGGGSIGNSGTAGADGITQDYNF